MLERFGCLWIALAIIGGLVAISAILPKRAAHQSTPAEYEACIAKENVDFVKNCYRETLATDMNKSRLELPVMPSPEERVESCRAKLGIGRGMDKYYPDAQRVCGKKPE